MSMALCESLRANAVLTEKAIEFMTDPEQIEEAKADIALWRATADEIERNASAIRSSLWDALVRQLGDQGRVEFQVDRQASRPYCSVRGLGVDAGGYATVEEAFQAWLEALPLLRERRAAE